MEHEITSRDKLQHKVEMRLKTDFKINKPFTEISLGYSSNFTLVLKYQTQGLLIVFVNWINDKTHIALKARVELDEERWLERHGQDSSLHYRRLYVVILDDDVLLEYLDGIDLICPLPLSQHDLSTKMDLILRRVLSHQQ